MRIKTVTVEYKELRSAGYPNFSNVTYGLNYTADVEENEDVNAVKRLLLEKAIKEVKLLHGDKIDDFQLKLFKIDEGVPF